MKKVILGTFTSRDRAERLIKHLSQAMGVSVDDISYIYRSSDGTMREGDSGELLADAPTEGAAAGAMVGGSMGALAGIATVMGVIPVIGPIFAAGPILTALGIGTGAVGMTAAGALTGAIAGGILGALVNLGVSETEARHYEERVQAGDVLVVVHAENDAEVKGAFASHDASTIHTYIPAVAL